MTKYDFALISYIRNSDDPDATMAYLETLLFTPNQDQDREKSETLSAPPVS